MQVIYARDTIHILFEACLLSITVLGTFSLRKEAKAVNIHTSLGNMLLHDGMFIHLSSV